MGTGYRGVGGRGLNISEEGGGGTDVGGGWQGFLWLKYKSQNCINPDFVKTKIQRFVHHGDRNPAKRDFGNGQYHVSSV